MTTLNQIGVVTRPAARESNTESGMRISTSRIYHRTPEEIDAVLTDFDQFERRIRAHGVKLHRHIPEPARTAAGRRLSGTGWRAVFNWRGRERRVACTLSAYAPARRMRLDMASRPLDAEITLLITPLDRDRSQVKAQLCLRPKNLLARLAMRALKLARKRALRRMNAALDLAITGK